MKLNLKNFSQNPTVFMRSLGYAFDRNVGEEMSFMRRLSGQDYPRFHAYISKNGNDLIINLHLDQKKPSYPPAGGGLDYHSHSGEYEGSLIEEEIIRINKNSSPKRGVFIDFIL